MAECCNPVILPSCDITCPQLYNACCVVDEQDLDCIFEPIVTTATGIIAQFTIVVSNAAGIVVGLVASGDGIGVGAEVTVVAGVQITLSIANSATFPAAGVGDVVTFRAASHTQCEINEEVNSILCDLEQGIIPCHTYTNVVFETQDGFTWTPLSPVQYSDKLSCQIRLRGIAQTIIDGTQTFQVTTTVFTIPAGPARPAVAQVFSLVVQILDPLAVGNTAIFLPALFSLGATGIATLTVIHPNPCDPCSGSPYFDITHDLTLTVSFDGLTYDTQP